MIETVDTFSRGSPLLLPLMHFCCHTVYYWQEPHAMVLVTAHQHHGMVLVTACQHHYKPQTEPNQTH